MKIWYCASEAAPIIKIGGLGDVAGSLPKALAEVGVEPMVILPHYKVIDSAKWQTHEIGRFTMPFGQPITEQTITVSQTMLPHSQVPVLLLANDAYIADGGQVAYEGTVSETDRFAFFSKAIVSLLFQPFISEHFGFPDVINCNDWHTAMVPVLLKALQSHLDKAPKTVLTIHNLAYQGVNDRGIIDRLALTTQQLSGIQWSTKEADQMNSLLEGIMQADFITTVSENYAKEILTPVFGAGLDDELMLRRDRLAGIVNGLDYQTWNPETDPYLAQTYGVETHPKDILHIKRLNKSKLQKACGLDELDKPVIGFIGRMEPIQKGIDLIYDWLTEMVDENGYKQHVQFVLLGTGDKEWEDTFEALSTKHPHEISVHVAFNERLAHMIYGGCDAIVVPSKFEPCGLPQMIAQRYGTIPIVHGVGGLKDTVVDGATGFVFEDYTALAMHGKIGQLIAIHNTEKQIHMIENGMHQDFSWQKSALKYKALYERVKGPTFNS